MAAPMCWNVERMRPPHPSFDAPRRVLVLGLDGADWQVADPLIEEGRLPNLAGLIAAGVRAPLASTIPPLTAPAWISFLLGAGPGSHGVLDFLERDARRYEGTTGRVVNSTHYPRQTFLDVAGGAGRRVAGVRVPMMFPPWPVNGVLVSGGFTPGGRVFCRPAELAEKLSVGVIDIGKRLLELPEEEQMQTLSLQLHRAEQQARLVFGMERFDLGMVHVHTPDNAHHCFWHHLEERRNGDNRVHALYEEVDRFVGRMVDEDQWDLVVVASDHGGGPRPTRRLLVDVWLHRLGLLALRGGYRARLARSATILKRRFKRLGYRLRRWAPQRLQRGISSLTQSSVAIDWGSTRAYGVHLFQPYYGIELNVRGRQPEGTIEPEDLAATRSDLVAKLEDSARRLGLPVVRVMTAEEAFGPSPDPRLPDVVVQLEDDVQGDAALGPEVVVDNGRPGPHEGTGGHSRDGILVMAGPGVRPGALTDVRIEDVAPTILAYLGISPPASMTGRVIDRAFEEGVLSEVAPSGHPAIDRWSDGLGDGEQGITAEEEEEILESLRGLGYVE
jgi:predicted AlkP superfamily phosphohydrolase/phosphomutase